MNRRNRNRLLWLASFLARRAAGLRKYVKRVTPRRERREGTCEHRNIVKDAIGDISCADCGADLAE